MTGPPVISLAVSQSIQNEAWWIGIGSIVIVTALLVVTFRSGLLLLAIALPTAVGAIVGALAVQLLFGSVHGIALTFGGTLAGVHVRLPRAPHFSLATWLYTQERVAPHLVAPCTRSSDHRGRLLADDDLFVSWPRPTRGHCSRRCNGRGAGYRVRLAMASRILSDRRRDRMVAHLVPLLRTWKGCRSRGGSCWARVVGYRSGKSVLR